MVLGINILKEQLENIGYKCELIENRFVKFDFKIPVGRFKNREIEVALEAPQFPLNPPSGPYIKPHIMPITNGGGTHPTGGIHARNIPSPEWQYWSRPFKNWNNSKKNASDYIAFLRTLFDFE